MQGREDVKATRVEVDVDTWERPTGKVMRPESTGHSAHLREQAPWTDCSSRQLKDSRVCSATSYCYLTAKMSATKAQSQKIFEKLKSKPANKVSRPPWPLLESR